MEKSLRFNVLAGIGIVYEQSKDSKLDVLLFSKIDQELSCLSNYFGVTKIQALLTALIFALNYKGEPVDFHDLTSFLDCNPMKIFEFTDDFRQLQSQGILLRKKSRHRMRLAGINDQFVVNEKVTEALLENQPLPDIKREKTEHDVIRVLEMIEQLTDQRGEDEITTRDMLRDTEELIALNRHFPLIERIERYNFKIEDTLLYYYLIWQTLSGHETIDIGRFMSGVYDDASRRIKQTQKLLTGENELIKNDLVELVEAHFFNDTEMKMTDKSFNLLKECGINLICKKGKKDNVLLPTEIPHRELVFSTSEMEQIELLKGLLQEEKFQETRIRLAGKNLPTGITVLLHGTPGTGKTEIVKQIAKETNRQVMKVEISQSKSMWFGESEKIIKRIFTDYRVFVKECELTPILLFNEGDAIISKRKEAGSSTVSQTENAIQNILLEEMDNFEGILIATTNLVNNLDQAFERRFLFKIAFKKPDASIRSRIWKLKMPGLTTEQCRCLAGRYSFSGGQIDNILRKKEIQEIIQGHHVSFDDLLAFCSQETWIGKDIKVGF